MAGVRSKSISSDPMASRAARKSREEWEQWRPTIVDLYSKNSLVEVIRIMKETHKFDATKRQYVFKLGQWNVKKYNVPDKTGPNEFSNIYDSMSRISGIDDETSTPAGKGASSNQAFQFPPQGPATEHAPYALIGLVPGAPPPGTDTQKQQEMTLYAADLCSALSDDEPAFMLYRQLRKGGPPLGSPEGDYLLIACARSVETQAHADKIRRDARGHPCNMDRSESYLLWKLLEAFITERRQPAPDDDERYLRENIRNQLNRGAIRRLPRRHRSIDMVAYMLLGYALEKYYPEPASNGVDLGDRVKSKESIFSEFVEQQNFTAFSRDERRADRALRACIKWCVEKLGSNFPMPLDILSMNCTDSLTTWKEDIAVFCYLWHQWWDEYSGGHGPDWARNSFPDLGLSFSDLLITVSWMIMRCESDTMQDAMAGVNGSAPETAPETTPAQALLAQAKEKAIRLSEREHVELWGDLLEEVITMNRPDTLGLVEKRFTSDVFKRTREYIFSTLGVHLHPPQDAEGAARLMDLSGPHLDGLPEDPDGPLMPYDLDMPGLQGPIQFD